MEREKIDLSTIPNFRDLCYGEEIYDNDEDDAKILYSLIQDDTTDYDLEKGYAMKQIVFQRESDQKYFTFEYMYSPHYNDRRAITATEVFPIEANITLYR